MKKVVLITGAAGFIGFHLWKLLAKNYQLILVDSLAGFSNYEIKKHRLQHIGIETKGLKKNTAHSIKNNFFYFSDITDKTFLNEMIVHHKIKYVIHLAAATGVRQSITQPELYTQSNIIGFNNLLDVCKENKINNIIYASSSSVYGNDTPSPFKETAECNHPLSYYAVTKKNNEMTAETYVANFNMNIIGLRFFTVYGPWSRSDMANYKFMNAIFEKKPITLFNNGNFKRDFTYVTDIVHSIKLLLQKMIEGNTYKNEIYNIGNSTPILVKDYLSIIETAMNKKAIAVNQKADKEEMDITYSDSSKLFNEINYKPIVSIKEGVKNSVEWFLKYKKAMKNKFLLVFILITIVSCNTTPIYKFEKKVVEFESIKHINKLTIINSNNHSSKFSLQINSSFPLTMEIILSKIRDISSKYNLSITEAA